jgi:hypothetical protein
MAGHDAGLAGVFAGKPCSHRVESYICGRRAFIYGGASALCFAVIVVLVAVKPV